MIHLLGADQRKDLSDDNNSSFHWYTELGWEVSVGRPWVLHCLQEGRINRGDSIVTTKERMFFYSNLGVAVEEYTGPIECKINPTNYGDWLRYLYYDKEGKHVHKYPNEHIDFDYEEVKPEPCVVMIHRVRGWVPKRNMKDHITKDFISMIMDKGLKPYIVGQNAEDVDHRAEYIDSLRTIASIMHHDNCRAVIGAGGISLLAWQVHKRKIVFLTTCGNENPFGDNPLYFSRYQNYNGCALSRLGPEDVLTAEDII